MSAIIILVVWTGCLAVGLLGMVLPYRRAAAAPKDVPALKAEIVQVELTNDPLPPLEQRSSLKLPAPPQSAPVLPSVAPSPPPIAVAKPDTVAFALPVEGTVSQVTVRKADFSATVPSERKAEAAVPVQVLTYGLGEGRQPAPEYPLRARREGQEGVVTVRFSVGEDGRVLASEAAAASPWKMLNDAAVRVVRERWRFPSGPIRLYEVSIRFQLTH